VASNSDTTDLLETVRARLAQTGLDLVGVASASAYDATVPERHRLAVVAPDARSAIVIGNGGRAFWDAFARGRRRWSLHPLDAFTRAVVTDALTPLPAGARLVFPFDFPGTPVSFVHLAECAGLGRRSLLGVLVHPEYGPWMALRAAVLLPDALPPTTAPAFDPCPTCVERPCIAACPAGAVSANGWDVPGCMAHRLRPIDDCAAGCHARIECVYGREHRYPPEAMTFHQRAARRTMASLARR
jgi:epoxyqueuosine reductase QueG